MSRQVNTDRRKFLTRASMFTLGCTSSWMTRADSGAAMETARIRLFDGPFLCFAPLYVAEALLRLEGFTDITYLKGDSGASDEFADIEIWGAPTLLPALERGAPLKVIAGLHVGCWELFAQESVKGVRDLKSRRIAVNAVGSVEHLWFSSLLGYVGIDARTQVHWVQTGSLAASQRAFLAGEADAFLAFPPQPQEMRLLKRGQVLINTTFDRPWSQYFCCMLAARNDYVERYPVATKHALRALLKAADMCASEPARVARLLREKGIESREAISLEVLKDLPYNRWRYWDPRDTLRFHAIRLRDAGMIQRSPARILERDTDFRMLEALRREMRA